MKCCAPLGAITSQKPSTVVASADLVSIIAGSTLHTVSTH